MHAVSVFERAAQRQLAGKGQASAGNIGYCVQTLLKEAEARAVVVHAVAGGLHLQGEQVRTDEAGIDGEQVLQAAQQQSRADQQHQGNGDLGDYEDAARLLVAAGGTLRACLQRGMRIAVRGVDRRNQSDRHADERGDSHREGEYRTVHRDRADRGSCAGLSASNTCTPIFATTIPRHPPRAASKRLSVRSWRSNRVRGAPSAARMANSLRRCAPRASSRLVTLTQAMINTKMTAPISASNAGLTPLVTSAWSEFTISPQSSAA